MADVSADAYKVGDPVPVARHTVDQAMINAWSELSGDVNPLHIDEEFARATRFGGTIAHGHLSLTWLCEAMLGWHGPGWLAGGALTGVRFVGPVRPGDTVRVEGEVVEVDPDAGSVACDIRVVQESSGDVCVVGKASLPLGEDGEV